jgi:predicted nucleic acid-binding protein
LNTDRVKYGLLDTSVLVAAEKNRALRVEGLPEAAATSIITVAELRAGVLAASDVETRDRRLATFELVARSPILPIDGSIARIWAGMRAHLAASGRSVKVNDVWIAATAASREIPLITQDADFDALSGVGGLTVVPV